MDTQIITKTKIDQVVTNLPSFYIKSLARQAFGRATAKNIRTVKHWRSGNMADAVLTKKIYTAALNLSKQYETEQNH